MNKPIASKVYDLREVSEYIDQVEKKELNLLDFYLNASPDYCSRYCSRLRIDMFDEATEEQIKEEEWTEEDKLSYRNSMLIYSHFPDADYFEL
jgi:cell division septum initiation protein DivIVA